MRFLREVKVAAENDVAVNALDTEGNRTIEMLESYIAAIFLLFFFSPSLSISTSVLYRIRAWRMIYLGLAAVFRSEKERPVLPYMVMDDARTTTEQNRLY